MRKIVDKKKRDHRKVKCDINQSLVMVDCIKWFDIHTSSVHETSNNPNSGVHTERLLDS